MTITIDKTETKKVSVEINLPAYYKWGHFFFKIISENELIQVRETERFFGISKEASMNLVIASALEEGQAITDDEFCAAFTRVGEKVKRELVKAMESDAWKQQEQEKSIAEEMEAYELGGGVEDSLNKEG